MASRPESSAMFGWWLTEWLTDPMYLSIRMYLALWGYENLASLYNITKERSQECMRYFAVYGSLREGGQNYPLIMNHVTRVGRAAVPGRLYQVSEDRTEPGYEPYPALKFHYDPQTIAHPAVMVDVYKINSKDPSTLLEVLDWLEVYTPGLEDVVQPERDQPERDEEDRPRNEYVRRFRPLVPGRGDIIDAPMGVWIYEYANDVKGFEEVGVWQPEPSRDHAWIIRPLKRLDLDQVEALQETCYPGLAPGEMLTADLLERHLRIFPDGQLVAIDPASGRLVGFAGGFLTNFDFDHPDHNFLGITDNLTYDSHNPVGRRYYSTDVSVHPDHQRQGIARALYRARDAVARQHGATGIVAGGLLPGYCDYDEEHTAAQYVDKVVSGEITDPTLSPQLRLEYQVLGTIENYCEDEPSRNWASLIYRPVPTEPSPGRDQRPPLGR